MKLKNETQNETGKDSVQRGARSAAITCCIFSPATKSCVLFKVLTNLRELSFVRRIRFGPRGLCPDPVTALESLLLMPEPAPTFLTATDGGVVARRGFWDLIDGNHWYPPLLSSIAAVSLFVLTQPPHFNRASYFFWQGLTKPISSPCTLRMC